MKWLHVTDFFFFFSVLGHIFDHGNNYCFLLPSLSDPNQAAESWEQFAEQDQWHRGSGSKLFVYLSLYLHPPPPPHCNPSSPFSFSSSAMSYLLNSCVKSQSEQSTADSWNSKHHCKQPFHMSDGSESTPAATQQWSLNRRQRAWRLERCEKAAALTLFVVVL